MNSTAFSPKRKIRQTHITLIRFRSSKSSTVNLIEFHWLKLLICLILLYLAFYTNSFNTCGCSWPVTILHTEYLYFY